MNSHLLPLRRLALLSFVLAFPILSFADVVVFGVVRDLTTKQPLTEIAVTATEQNSGTQVPVVVRENGRYEINIIEAGDYVVEFGSPGHVPKRVQLDLRGPSLEEWKYGYGLNTDISLFREVEGLDLTLGKRPFAICRFDKAAATFNWDQGYSDAQRDRTEQLLKEYEQRVPSSR